MNRIYKVIWSKVRHCYVVVSELAKKDGKFVSTRGRVSKKMAASLAVMALCAGMTSGVMAANTATGTGSGIAYGTGSKAPNAGSVAVGYNANAAGDYSLALGMSANSSGYLSIAQGYAAQASGLQSVAIGLQTQATNEAATAIGRSVQATGIAAIGIGLSGVAAGNDSIVMGRDATATTTAVNGIALGIGSYIGAEVTPGGQPSEGVPDNSLAVTDDDTSSGKPNQDHMNSIALGNTAKAFGYQNTSLGAGAETYDTNSLAVGVAAHARGNYASAIGKQASAYGLESTALGHWARAYGDNAIAIGTNSITFSLDGTDSVNNAIAIGQKARVASNNSIALGQNSLAYIPTGVATKAYLTDEAFSADNGIVSVGNTEYKIGEDAVAENRRRITNVAGGAESYDAVNVAQLKAVNDKVDANKISYFSVNSTTEANKDNDGATGVESIAIGGSAKAKHYQSIAIGGFTEAANMDSIAIGYLASATEMADNGVSIGRETRNTVPNGIALGSYSVADRRENILSYDPLTESNFNFTPEMQTALDAWNAAAAVYYQNPTPENAQAAKDAGMKYRMMVAPWMAGMGSLSLGNGEEGLTRQITNVAAGTIDTDAVNIAQLKAAKVEVLAGTNISSIDKDTSAGYTQYKVNAKDTITDSAALSGDTITFTRNDGTTYTVNNVASKSALDANKISFFSVNPEGFVVTSNEDNKGATGSHAMAIGIDASANGQFDTAIGKGAVASAGDAIAIGTQSKASGGTSTAIGERAEATSSNTIALGSGSKAIDKYGIAIGAVSKATNLQTIAIGPFAEALEEESIAIGYFASAAKGAYDGVAIGRGSGVSMVNGIALGAYSITDRDGNYLGYDPVVGGDVAFTSEMQAAMDAANEAIYNRNQNPTPENDQKALEAMKKYRLAVAPWISGASALSIGNKEEGLTRQITNVAAGSTDTDAVNVAQLKAAKVEVLAGTNISSIDKDTSAGYTQYKVNAKDTITDSAALSGDTITFTRNDGTTYKVSGLASTSALETNKTRYFSVKSTDAGNRNNDGATGENALAVGVRAKATNTADTAIGYNASASGSWGIAAGAGSKSTGALGIAMGYGANAAANQSIAIGYAATVKKADSLAIGRETQANEANAMAIGLTAKANANQSMALGYGALTESTANNGIAMGVDAYVGAIRSTDPVQGIPGNSTSIVDDDTVVAPEKAQMNSVAIGNSAKAFGYQTTALGAGAEAHDTNSLAVGIMAIGKGNYATALGKQAYANGNEATALGHWARAYGDNAIAIGSYAITNTLDGTGTVSNGVAIGQKARAASDNSVALGQNSLAYVPDNVKTEAYLTNEAFSAPNGVVSVGNAEYTIGDTTVASNRRRITNVAGGADDYDAVNVAQLKALSNKLTQDAADSKLSSGKNITINTTTDDNGVKTNTIDLNDKITLNNAAAPGQQVIVDGTASNITAGTGDNQVAVNGSAGQVTIGAGDSQMVIGKQADAAKNKEGNVINPDKTGNYITGLDNTTWNPAEKGIVENRAATEGQLRDAVNSISTEIGDINTDIEAIQNAKRDFISDTGEKIEVSNAETLSIKGGAAADSLTEGNIGVVNDGTKGFKVKLSSKLSGLDSVSAKTVTASDSITVGSGDTTTVISGDAVTTGNTTVNTKGLTVAGSDDSTTITVQSDNVSMGGNKIQNVAAGKAITDAVNVGQLNEAVTTIGSGMNQLGNQINKLDNRVDRVGAGAAALAALHPLEYDPTTRWEVSAGIGNYRGANAVAVGAFYRPNYDTMVSIGSSYGGGENMVNAGVTWRIGEGGSGNYQSKGAMAQEINDLRSVVDEQNSKLASQSSQIESQSEQLSAQSNEIKAQRQQLEEQNQKIEQLMQAIAALKK